MFELSDLVKVSGRVVGSNNTTLRIILVNRGRGPMAWPEVRMKFVTRDGSSLEFENGRTINSGNPATSRKRASGVVSVRVTAFAGEPGSPQCHGQSVSALARKYGGMVQAASALNYSSVDALQADIALFCGS